MVDLAFLQMLVTRGYKDIVVLPKSVPTETDVCKEGVEWLLAESFGGLQVKVLDGGSPIQGNLLTNLSPQFQDAMERLRTKSGLLVAKGIANLATVPGVLIDTLFLFAVKSDVVARDLTIDQGSIVGLYLPAGASRHDSIAQLYVQYGCAPDIEREITS